MSDESTNRRGRQDLVQPDPEKRPGYVPSDATFGGRATIDAWPHTGLSEAGRLGLSNERLGRHVRWLMDHCVALEIDILGDHFHVSIPGLCDCRADSLNAAVYDACRKLAEARDLEAP